MTADEMVRLLEPHWRTDCSGSDVHAYVRWVRCRCGWESRRSSSLVNAPDLHRIWIKHLTDVLSATEVETEEPIDVGWYAYSGGAQTMIFHLRETGQWSAHFDNGTSGDCAWGYIEQALGVWDLVLIASPAVLSERGEQHG